MASDTEIKRWKKRTYLNVDILIEDEFYAKTPQMNKDYPITDKAKHTIIGTNTKRSTIEEIDVEMEKIINEVPTSLLDTQYRMNESIMSFSNAEFYDGRLIAHESVAHAVLEVSK